MSGSTNLDVRAFRFPVRVYWEDTDAGGVVFYANYLKFFERARTEWLRHLGFSQEALRTQQRLMFVVAETSLQYRAPARLDELLHITALPQPAGRASLVVNQQAWRGDTLLAEGRIRIGCVDADTFRPRRMPDELINTLTSQAG
ncbi:tol-pal system-associated acyl-CoA thioesterase [Azohydromonas lata]|uniref:Tol-pal system-associated acyl-CoA thioesterase n=1 Tax=Azohydromonas lata TaxID=45677 RepID=A0ABU5IDJ9_9BURK|nr:tol-pal system-associated acyl-CoA thioesterase [Azohydromonas lata]MDZ5457195.1 tol-pal system-associated acyl-CoA thioesterase [Azohydromonas lata]